MKRSRWVTSLFGGQEPGRSLRSSALVCLLATAALLVTSFDLHPHTDLRMTTAGNLPVFSEAVHPEEAPHIEDAGQPSTQHCLACLLQLHNQADNAPRPVSEARTGPAGLARTAAPVGTRAPERHSGGSRAPPTI